jgi:hypothetical protein
MNYRKHALVLAVIRGLHVHGSWTGKTHVQKALFLMKAAARIEVPFAYVLYKHGPYSFELESELEQMQSYAAVKIEPNAEGFGVVLTTGPGAGFATRLAQLSKTEQTQVELTCQFVGNRNMADLERLATAAWIRMNEGRTESHRVAARLNQLKPHISVPQAEAADAEVFSFLSEAQA